MLPGQIHLFEETTVPSMSVTGLQVLLQSECRKCGGRLATIGFKQRSASRDLALLSVQ